MCTIAASIITAVVGGIWQGYTANQQAKAQASQAEANARIAEQNAQKLDDQAMQTAENNRINAENRRRQNAAQLAKQELGIAAAGLSPMGSALNALADSQYEMEKEMAVQGYNDRQQVDNIFQRSTDQTNAADMYHQQAKDYRRAGRWAWANGLIGAGMNVVTNLAPGLYGAKSAAVQNAGGAGAGNNYSFDQTYEFGKRNGSGATWYSGDLGWNWRS